MRTARSSSRRGIGGGLDMGLETPRVWAWRPPGVGLETPQVWVWRHPGVGLETPLARHLNFPLGVSLETCKACWDTTPPPPGDLLQDMLGNHLHSMLGYHLAPWEQNHRHV